MRAYQLRNLYTKVNNLIAKAAINGTRNIVLHIEDVINVGDPITVNLINSITSLLRGSGYNNVSYSEQTGLITFSMARMVIPKRLIT